MKKIFLLIGLCILFTGFVSLNSQGQEAEMPADFLVFEEFVSPSNLAAFKEAQSEAVSQWKKHEWDVYNVVFGHDTPCMIFMTRSESELAMRKLEKDLNSKYKKDFQKLWSEFVPYVRKIENKKGWFWPGWSMNLPE